MKKKNINKRKPKNKSIKGIDIRINEFGEIVSNYSIEKLNQFLNDKKEGQKLGEFESSEEEE